MVNQSSGKAERAMQPEDSRAAGAEATGLPWLDAAARAEGGEAEAGACWTVLIVDDDRSVHEVTGLVLSSEPMLGRRLEFLHAYSEAEARVVLRERGDIALLLLDVVMENDHAGLDLVGYVRDELGNAYTRILLRTGQPGLAPQKEVVRRYDINGYLDKAQLTSPQLFCAVHTALSAYRQLVALEAAQNRLKQALDTVKRNEARFRLLLDSSPIGLAERDLDGRFTGANPALCAMLGYSEAELLRLSVRDITHPDDLALDLAKTQQLLAGQCASYRLDKRYLHQSGRSVHVQLDVALVRDEAGQPSGFISQVQGIDQRIAAQTQLQALAQRLALAVRAAHIGVWAWDAKTGQLSWDAQMYHMYGIPEGTTISWETWKQALLPEDAARSEAVLARALELGCPSDNRFRIVHPTLGVRHIEATEDVVLDATGKFVTLVGVSRDVTRQRQLEDALLQRQAEMLKLSLTDPLTGVANRRRLDEQLDVEVNRVQRYGGTLSLAVADLDHFKRINDEYGHETGDAVLKAFTRIMEAHVRDVDLVARQGGEEFVILMPQSGRDAAETVAERIRQCLAHTPLPPLRLPVTVSLGVAEIQPGETAAELLRRADQAVYGAKAGGRNRTVVAPDVPPRPPGRLQLIRKQPPEPAS